jgi:hypothetical protein
MRIKLLIACSLMSTTIFAQDKVEIANQNGIVVTYEKKKISADADKKDKYLFYR